MLALTMSPGLNQTVTKTTLTSPFSNTFGSLLDSPYVPILESSLVRWLVHSGLPVGFSLFLTPGRPSVETLKLNQCFLVISNDNLEFIYLKLLLPSPSRVGMSRRLSRNRNRARSSNQKIGKRAGRGKTAENYGMPSIPPH